MHERTSLGLTVLRLLYAVFWVAMAVSPLILSSPFPRQPTPEANAFWDAIAATGFMVPMIGATYLAGGLACLAHRSAPLGLALLSVPLAVIVPFNALLARQAGPWIAIAVAHVALLVVYRRAYVALWSFGV